MFENEAEERTKQHMNELREKYNCENTKLETDNYNAGCEQGYEDGFKDGAEFGYNKANEWNYPSKGECPKDYSTVNIMYYDGVLIRTRIAVYANKEWWDDCNEIGGELHQLNKRYVVVAWKEIVLPELPKEWNYGIWNDEASYKRRAKEVY